MEKPKYRAPCLNIDGSFIKAPSFKIAGRVNERLARKMDASRIIDEINSDAECIRDYYYETKCDEPPESEGQRRRRLWRNRAFHFRGEEL